ncbi:MAG TPA: hypothetical protein VD813_04115 [Pseudonocardia sp.]|nr:hypothetical protein [Pseudonocardia sp.]
MKRLFWLGLGVAVGVYATRRATEAAQSLTPAGVGANIADGLRELGAGLGAFGAEVRAGMVERERELAELVERRTGSALPGYADALGEDPGARAPGAGARRPSRPTR